MSPIKFNFEINATKEDFNQLVALYTSAMGVVLEAENEDIPGPLLEYSKGIKNAFDTWVDENEFHDLKELLEQTKKYYLENRETIQKHYMKAVHNVQGELNGLNHSMEHLEQVINDVALWPIEKQLEYADKVIKLKIHDYAFMADQILNMPDAFLSDESIKNNINTTAIGNIAYIAHNVEFLDVKVRAKEILQVIKAYFVRKAVEEEI